MSASENARGYNRKPKAPPQPPAPDPRIAALHPAIKFDLATAPVTERRVTVIATRYRVPVATVRQIAGLA